MEIIVLLDAIIDFTFITPARLTPKFSPQIHANLDSAVAITSRHRTWTTYVQEDNFSEKQFEGQEGSSPKAVQK